MAKTFKELRTIVAKNKLTQKELADVTGIAKRTIEDYENSNRDFRKANFENICKIADALGLELDDFR